MTDNETTVIETVAVELVTPDPLYSRGQCEAVLRQLGYSGLIHVIDASKVAGKDFVEPEVVERIRAEGRYDAIRSVSGCLESLVAKHGVNEVVDTVGRIREARVERMKEALEAIEEAKKAVEAAEQAVEEVNDLLEEMDLATSLHDVSIECDGLDDVHGELEELIGELDENA